MYKLTKVYQITLRIEKKKDAFETFLKWRIVSMIIAFAD